MVAPVRYTSQKRQERISRRQLCERLDEFGWIATPPDEDLGEDFIVHIYLDGRATGVTFHVQEKSVTNLHERRKGDFLVYDFEVKDLKHWENFSLPVVLVVWDIELREGRWVLIDDAISELDQRRPNWRDNKSKASVYIPWSNTTDDAGFKWLKYSILPKVYPLIAKDRQPEIKNLQLHFSDTQEGKATQAAYERFLKEGEQATIRGEYIREVEFSKWLGPWIGKIDPNRIDRVVLGPRIPSQTFPVIAYLISNTGEITPFPNIELQVTKAGRELAQLSNEHQNSLLHFRLTYQKPDTYTLECKVNNLRYDVCVLLHLMRFLRGTGGRIQLTFSTLENASLDISISPDPEKSPNHRTLQLINNLCKIQKKTGQPLLIKPFGEYVDFQEIDKFISIIDQGKAIRKPDEIIIEFDKKSLETILDIHRQNEPIQLGYFYDESYVEPLDQKIQIGRMTRHITGIPKMSVTELGEAITKLNTIERLAVTFVDIKIVEVFPDWFIREAERLSQLLAEKFGVEAVYLFGSLVWSDIHTPETDIDLAVSGLPNEQFLEAVSYLERESKFPIDLVDLSKVSDHLRQRILTEGKLLYEREPVAAFG
jgi:predicted nucleotidyltransferase